MRRDAGYLREIVNFLRFSVFLIGVIGYQSNPMACLFPSCMTIRTMVLKRFSWSFPPPNYIKILYLTCGGIHACRAEFQNRAYDDNSVRWDRSLCRNCLWALDLLHICKASAGARVMTKRYPYANGHSPYPFFLGDCNGGVHFSFLDCDSFAFDNRIFAFSISIFKYSTKTRISTSNVLSVLRADRCRRPLFRIR